MLEAQRQPDAVAARQVDGAVDAPELDGVELAAELVFDVVEGMSHPDADEVAAVGGKEPEARLELLQHALLVEVEPGEGDVQADGDERGAVAGFEVARVPGADADESAELLRGGARPAGEAGEPGRAQATEGPPLHRHFI